MHVHQELLTTAWRVFGGFRGQHALDAVDGGADWRRTVVCARFAGWAARLLLLRRTLRLRGSRLVLLRPDLLEFLVLFRRQDLPELGLELFPSRLHLLPALSLRQTGVLADLSCLFHLSLNGLFDLRFLGVREIQFAGDSRQPVGSVGMSSGGVGRRCLLLRWSRARGSQDNGSGNDQDLHFHSFTHEGIDAATWEFVTPKMTRKARNLASRTAQRCCGQARRESGMMARPWFLQCNSDRCDPVATIDGF